jgi:hypothetical protein
MKEITPPKTARLDHTDKTFAALSEYERWRVFARHMAQAMLAMIDAEDPLLTVQEAAKLYLRDDENVRLWCKAGLLGRFDRSGGPRG